MDFRALLISDSRGRGIKTQLIEKIPETNNITWDEIILPGATLERIQQRLERSQRRNKWDLVIIIGGICNFTTRTVTKRTRLLEYKTSKLDKAKEAINNILVQQGLKTHICTLTPASLVKYSTEPTPQTITEQEELIKDIEELNNHIATKNIERDSPTIDLARQSYTSSLKKQGNKRKRISKFNDKDLEDGVHPSAELQDKWTTYMAQVISKIAHKIRPEDQDESSSSEDEETESWNFKRQNHSTI